MNGAIIMLFLQIAPIEKIAERAKSQAAMNDCVAQHVLALADDTPLSDAIDLSYRSMLTGCRAEVALFRNKVFETIAKPDDAANFVMDAENAAIRNAVAARPIRGTPPQP
ncbi:MAG: hypothetical protein LCH74_20190 [Proteobacteria bacterium]|nr:hypothetical protein [Pseudomonadota bacterium]